MTKHRISILLLAVLTVAIFCACGDTVETSSEPEGIQTFGMDVDPSSEPNTGEVIGGETTPDASSTKNPSGPVVEGDTESSAQPSESTSTSSPSTAPTATRPPSTSTPTSEPSESPSASPAISPPAPASTATADEAAAYVGQPLSDLIADLGYPIRSDYEDVDEDDPDAGKIGTLYFDGFTVTTLRDNDGETITAVTPD